MRRCLVFCGAPGAFVLFAIIYPVLEHVELTAWDCLTPLVGLFTLSVAGIAIDHLLPHSRAAVIVFQLFFQYVFLLYCLSTLAAHWEHLQVPEFQPAQTKSVNTISIVIPCLNETFAVNTVNRFCERTPPQFLEEIIVVDDASWPTMASILEGKVDAERCKLRILRHEQALGLMVAKQTGGDAALGEFIGFFDCHVCPNKGWYKEIIQLLRANPRRLVVPQIGDINLTSWDEKVGGALTAKCYINMNADFWWYEDDSDFIPIISGGLVAIGRKWWQESGGFEKGMRGWGGENSDQSLRTWLCGGDIVRAKTSRVAHMWRMSNDRRTVAHYRAPQFGVDNLARVAAAWFDEFKAVFREAGEDGLHGIDVSETLQKRQDLGCLPFAYFLHRFRKIYVDGRILADKVFRIRSSHFGTCIQRSGFGYRLGPCQHGTWFHLANRVPEALMQAVVEETADPDSDEPGEQVSCGGHYAKRCSDCMAGHDASWCHGDCMPSFGLCVHKKAIPPEKRLACCSGIREYKSLHCLDSLGDGGPLSYQCDVTGANGNQQYFFTRDGHIRHSSGRCLMAEAQARKVLPSPCNQRPELIWEKVEMYEAPDMRLYRDAVARLNLSMSIPDH